MLVVLLFTRKQSKQRVKSRTGSKQGVASFEDLCTVASRLNEILENVIRKTGESLAVDFIFLESFHILGETNVAQPLANLLDGPLGRMVCMGQLSNERRQ